MQNSLSFVDKNRQHNDLSFFNFTEYQYMVLDRENGFKVIQGVYSE